MTESDHDWIEYWAVFTDAGGIIQACPHLTLRFLHNLQVGLQMLTENFVERPDLFLHLFPQTTELFLHEDQRAIGILLARSQGPDNTDESDKKTDCDEDPG